jgi:hypothetical protein
MKLVYGMFVCALGAGCGSSGSPSTTPTTPTPATTIFQGAIAGTNNQSGTLTVTIQAQVAALPPSLFKLPFVATLHAQGTSATATGSFRAAGVTTTLNGTYDTSSRALSLSGGGYTFTGSSSTGAIAGTYVGPSGAEGAFSSRSTAGGTVTVYCGSAFGAPPDVNVVTGVFNFSVSDASGAISGVFTISADDPDTIGTLTGQLTGTTVSLTARATAGRFVGETASLTGTIQAGTFTGRSDTGNPVSGSTSRCQ